jgi:integrase
LRGPLQEILIHNENEKQQAQAMVATIFETGARIGEVIGHRRFILDFPGLKCKDIKSSQDAIAVVFSIEKRYDKTATTIKYRATNGTKMHWTSEEEAKRSGHPFEPYQGYLTKRCITIRNIVFPNKEPLVPIMMSWVEKTKKEKDENAKLFNISYNKAYRIITATGRKLGLDFPPHRLRAERATQLVVEYGFTDHDLTEWFSWKSPVVALDYTTVVPVIIEKMFAKYR